MHPDLVHQLAIEHQHDLAESALRSRSFRRRRRRPAESPDALVIRLARPGDAIAIERLARLEHRGVPRGSLLVAEVRGELHAAVGLGDGNVIADPFRPTADLVSLLRLRAGQLADGAVAARRRAPWPQLHS
jgi:hypothetical protein